MTNRLWPPDWLRRYQRDWLGGDLTAGLIVSVMLVPQSLAYALLAGLPPQAGLYASVLPLIAYALFGSSMTLAVGPVAVVSLMTAAAVAPMAAAGSPEYAALAVLLAMLSGAMLLAAGLLRLGFLAHFLSRPVIHGFIAGSAILITLGQLKYLLGIPLPGGTAITMARALPWALAHTNPTTAMIGGLALAYLVFARTGLPRMLRAIGVPQAFIFLQTRLSMMTVVVIATVYAAITGIDASAQVAVIGTVPAGLPALQLPAIDWQQIASLCIPALLISLVGFVESMSVAQSLGQKRGERIEPDRELLGIGVANVASALSGGFPVTGGFARSVINADAGARSPAAGIISAIVMAIVVAGLTQWFYYLPLTVLAATIIVAVLALIDFSALSSAWRYDKADAISMLLTFAGVLLFGVEHGILLGVVLSLATLVWRSSRPHMAVVGRVPGTEHYRNIERYQVQTQPGLIALRIDESLYFANAQGLEDRIESLTRAQPDARCVLLIMSAVNQLDTTALEMLTELELSLAARGIVLQLAEIKGPMLDRLRATPLGQRMQHRIFLSTHQAFVAFGEREALNAHSA